MIMGGFAFSELIAPIPEDTHPALGIVYLGFTALCMSLDMCIITWTVLVCVWGPGHALRGAEGMKSFHETVDFLKSEQTSIYYAFLVSVVAYFGSSSCLLWVYPSHTITNVAGSSILVLSFVVLLGTQLRLEHRVGFLGNSHDEVTGRIQGLAPFEDVADLDTFVASAVPDDAQASLFQRGMYD